MHFVKADVDFCKCKLLRKNQLQQIVGDGIFEKFIFTWGICFCITAPHPPNAQGSWWKGLWKDYKSQR